MKTELFVNPDLIQVKTVTRRYSNSFFTWANVEFNGEDIDMGDPYPHSVFPMCEIVFSMLATYSSTHNVSISESKFRSLFKGIKNGAVKYSVYAEKLEQLGVSLI